MVPRFPPPYPISYRVPKNLTSYIPSLYFQFSLFLLLISNYSFPIILFLATYFSTLTSHYFISHYLISQYSISRYFNSHQFNSIYIFSRRFVSYYLISQHFTLYLFILPLLYFPLLSCFSSFYCLLIIHFWYIILLFLFLFFTISYYNYISRHFISHYFTSRYYFTSHHLIFAISFPYILYSHPNHFNIFQSKNYLIYFNFIKNL